MKFLHEMIAKKRLQQAGEPVRDDNDDVVEAVTPGDDEFVAQAEQHDLEPEADYDDSITSIVAEAMHSDSEADEDEDWADDVEDDVAAEADEDAYDEQDDGDLFDDGSYDWELEDAETQEIPEEVEPAVAAHPDFSKLPARDDDEEDASLGDTDDEDDVRRGVSMVLKDLASRTEASGVVAKSPEPEPERPHSNVEQNVEKLRIQRKIWDMDSEADEPEVDEPAVRPAPEVIPQSSASLPPLKLHETQQTSPSPRRRAAAEPEAPAAESAPQPQAQPRRAGRVKTRLLGFHKADENAHDPFAAPQQEAAPQGDPQFPVGWMVVMQGPGRGASFTLTAGASKIGRGEDQAIRLDYGDNSISRDNHAAVAYDEEHACFYIGHGGKANLVRLNDMPVLSTEQLADGDEIRIGETTLRFVAFCGPEFSWDKGEDGEGRYAAAE